MPKPYPPRAAVRLTTLRRGPFLALTDAPPAAPASFASFLNHHRMSRGERIVGANVKFERASVDVHGEPTCRICAQAFFEPRGHSA